jgi:2-dehydropantoate 2-reductase
MYGAGAIGGIVGSKLHLAGHEVILIARGEHLRRIQQDGLTVRLPDGDEKLPIPAVAHPSEIEFRPGDVVMLAMKSQDTLGALVDLRAAVGDTPISVVCGQNGIENERLALRFFPDVYAMLLSMPATYLDPGVVEPGAWPIAGVCDLGRYPTGTDALSEAIAAEFEAAGLLSVARPDIMNWKYTKLLLNVGNAVGAVCGDQDDTSDLQDMARQETRACLRAAGFEWIPGPEFTERGSLFRSASPGGISTVARARGGSSTWQSLVRGAGSSEGDYLNGEVVLLGRIHGIPTPANEVFQQLSDRLARERKQPGSVSAAEARQMVEARRAVISKS